MPIVETRPARAFNRFESHIQTLVHGVLPIPPHVRLALTTRGNLGTLEFVRGGGIATSVPLATQFGELYLVLNQDLEAVREQKRRFRLRTKAYRYRLVDNAEPSAEAIVRWEYVADAPRDAWCRHHVQARGAVPAGEGALNLDRAHIPTGWVLIEDVLRFVFHDLHVEARTANWPTMLEESRQRFFEEFTGKRYRALT